MATTFAPMPTAAINAARQGVLHRGFTPAAVLEQYPLLTTAGTLTIDALAFAHATRRDLSGHAGITISNTVGNTNNVDRLRILAQSTAPFHIIHDDKVRNFSFYATSLEGNDVRSLCLGHDIAYDRLDEALAEFNVDLKPLRIANVKQGLEAFSNLRLRELRPLQLSLWVEDVTRRLLRERFVQAIESLRTWRGPGGRSKLPSTDVTKLAVQLLGAIVLADTGGFGNPGLFAQMSLSKLVGVAHDKFPRYFDIELFDSYQFAASRAYDILRDLSYGGFTPDMLTDLYNAAYDQKAKKALGRYDTPLYLTRRIWQAIPVELLPPDQRLVADMTCGWGSFLIAGHERLSRLSDMEGRCLRDHLFGNDNDSFTALLAGLALLLSSSEDSWNIDSGDARRWSWLNKVQPNIIVGNPPFGGDRKAEGPNVLDRHQKADVFLKHAITHLAPGGYLAMLMPRSFPVAQASHDVRQLLLEWCDILEMWELPKDVFTGASARTVTVFARKKATSNITSAPVRVRTVQNATLMNFKIDGHFTSSTIAVDQAHWNRGSRRSKRSQNDYLFDYHLILDESTWDSITNRCVPLGELATVTQGCIAGKPADGYWRNFGEPKQVPWLPDAKSALRQLFRIDYKSKSTIRYPNDLQWPRKNSANPEKDLEHIFVGTKVIMASVLEPGWDMRIKVAVERLGFFVPDNFMVFVPSSNSSNPRISVEVIAAVLSFPVAKAWLLEFMKSPKAPTHALRSLPFPKLSSADCRRIEKDVRAIETLSEDGEHTKKRLESIKTILTAAYGIDGEMARRLEVVANWGQSSFVSLDPSPREDESSWLISGIVTRVDAAVGTITFWLDGFNAEQTVPITPSIPGWMLRPEAAFRTHIPYAWRKAGRALESDSCWSGFSPQPRAYLDDSDIFSNLTDASANQ